MAEGRHRAKGKSTSEEITGKRNDASQGKHRAPPIPTRTKHADGGEGDVEGHKLGKRGAPPKYTEGDDK